MNNPASQVAGYQNTPSLDGRGRLHLLRSIASGSGEGEKNFTPTLPSPIEGEGFVR